MKNLFNYGSFLSHLNESETQNSSFMEVLKNIGGSSTDKDAPMVQFNNIKKIFGKADYATRFEVAQALKLLGDDQFPTNTYFPNFQKNKDRFAKDGIFITYYIGERDQNEKMDKISEDLLKAIKPIVDLMKRDPKGAGNFMSIEDSSIPEVKQSRVKASNIRK